MRRRAKDEKENGPEFQRQRKNEAKTVSTDQTRPQFHEQEVEHRNYAAKENRDKNRRFSIEWTRRTSTAAVCLQSQLLGGLRTIKQI
jgi:hypothetical protein